MRTLKHLGCWLALPAAGLLLSSRHAEAIPAFAAQTGQPCTACHIGGFGPQLTPFGRAFKVGGYTQRGGEGILASIPLSLMVQTSFNNTATNATAPHAPFGANNNFALDQVSGFVGGGIGDHTGGLIQFTWSQESNAANLDNTDLRPYTTTFDLGGKELRVGTTINNNPTVQDPYTSSYAWGFPYIGSKFANTPSGTPLLAGGLGQSALGYTAYAWYDNKLYLEGGLYSTLGSWALGRIGNNYNIGATTNPAPYLRAAYEWDWGANEAHVGALFMHADVSPATDLFATTSAFGTDHYTDYAIDADYQFLGDGTNTVTVQGIATHEDQNLLGSAAMNGIAGAQASLNQIHADVSYWYKNTYGVTLGWQKTWGTPNPVLFAAGGSVNKKPDSNAFILEADWVPFGKEDSQWAPLANLKLGVQYTAYTQFNGGTSNYDGAGSNASGNNALLMFAWFMF